MTDSQRGAPAQLTEALNQEKAGTTMHQPKTPEEQRNAGVIRELYAAAEAAAKDTPKFVSLFEEGGYFYDVAAGKKYYGQDIGYTVDVYATAFPDMHRELYNMYFNDDVVVVELSLNGTHKGDLAIPAGVIPPTNKEMHAPCCDVFQLKDGKVLSFDCYVAVPILLEQIGVFKNLSAAIRK
jgi:SnoaL-like domain